MAVGRISGPLLKSNLIRNGIDLAFETDLLYLDVNNQRIGIKTQAPTHELQINGTTRTTNLIVDNRADIADVTIQGSTISTDQQYLNLGTFDNVVYNNKLRVDNIDLEGNVISTNASNADLELRPNGTGIVDVYADMEVNGSIHATGDISADGSIRLGDADTDNVEFNAEVSSDIIPNLHNTYQLGSDPATGGKAWKDVWVNTLRASSIQSDSTIIDGIDLTLRQGNIWYVAENGDNTHSGDHQQDPVASIKYAVETLAQAGDTVYIYPGVYTEEFPINLPKGVSVRGHSLRSVKIVPTTETEYNDAFLLQGESTVEDITVADFYSGGNYFDITANSSGSMTMNIGITEEAHTYVSGGTVSALGVTNATITNATYDHTTGELVITHTGGTTTNGTRAFITGLVFSCSSGTKTYPNNGYAFRFATDFEVTSRSPYLKNITVITKGSTTTAEDPRGFNAGDAGKGAYIDGSYATTNSNEAAMLFHAVTFITPGVDAVTATNGVRIEWLNSFSYFANKGFNLFDSTKGKYSQGRTRVRLDGVTGTFAATETITFTSIDNSTVITGTIDQVEGTDIVYIQGKKDDFVGFDYTPFSIASSGGASATEIIDVDFREFGAEVRSIGSASVYGNFGLVGDGPGVIMYAIGHNLAYIGNGKEITNDPGTVIQANEVVESNGAKIRYNSVDHKGDFRVGDLFRIDQETGNVDFTVNDFVINTTDGVTFNTGGDTTFIDGTKIETGNWRFSGNTIETLSGPANFTAENNEIYLNGNVNVDGNIDVTGNVTIGGNITIGDEVTDTIQIVAGIDSDLLPSQDVTYNLGSASKRWKDLYVVETTVGDFNIRDNFIEVTASNADLELRANGTGRIFIPTNNVEIVENLTVNGNTDLRDTTVTGTITHTGDYNQTGDTTVVGSVTVTQDLDVSGAAQFEEILINDNFITTTTSNADLELRASGTGNILIPNNDVVVTGTTTIQGTLNVTDLVSNSNITASSFTTGDIEVYDNVVETTLTNSNLELRANGTGVVYIPSNDAIIDNNLTVNGTTTLSDTDITGNIIQTGNTTQTGNITLTGTLDVTGDVTINGTVQFENIEINDNYITTTQSNSDLELRGNGTGNIYIPNNDVVITNDLTVEGTLTVGDVVSLGLIQANNFTTGDILVDDNFITTTNSNSDLELRAAGTGSIVIDELSFNSNQISISTSDLEIATADQSVIFDSTGQLVIPKGNDLQRTNTAGAIRFNTDRNRFEGYNGTAWINLSGVEDLDGDTKVTAELTEGANDDTIRFTVAGTVVADINADRMNIQRLSVDDIEVDGNVISTITANTDLQLSANGTGSVNFENFGFRENRLTNVVADSNMVFETSGEGYYEFVDPYGIVLPVGDNTTRPSGVQGMIRYNTDDSRVELYDGTSWVSVAGASGGISFADAENIAIEKVLIFG